MPRTFLMLPKGFNKQLFDVPAIKEAIQSELNSVAEEAGQELATLTQAWRDKPAFKIKVSPWKIVVTTSDKVFGILNKGAPPHVILPKNAEKLRFQEGYRAGTSPDSLSSVRGESFGGEVFAREVMHPGIAPRNFTSTLAKKLQRKIPAEVQKAIGRALKSR